MLSPVLLPFFFPSNRNTLTDITKFGVVIQQDYENGSPTGKPTNGVAIENVLFTGAKTTVSVGSKGQAVKVLYVPFLLLSLSPLVLADRLLSLQKLQLTLLSLTWFGSHQLRSGIVQGQLGLVQSLRLQRQEGRLPLQRPHQKLQALNGVISYPYLIPLALYLAFAVLSLLHRPVFLASFRFASLSLSLPRSLSSYASLLAAEYVRISSIDWTSPTLASAISCYSF
jgi:hypothetical protein